MSTIGRTPTRPSTIPTSAPPPTHISATGSNLSQAYAGDLVLQEVNGDHAYVSGVELAYQQHLTFLPGLLANARINTNFTYTASTNYNVTGRTDNPSLVGQALFSWNITPAYATRRAPVTLGVSHNGANIYAYEYQSVGPGAVPYGVKGPNDDNYSYAHIQVDAQEPSISARASRSSLPDRT